MAAPLHNLLPTCSNPCTRQVDVFSLGVVLYELLSRTLLIFTELPVGTADPNASERCVAAELP